MAQLPFYKFYPSDFDSDERTRGMDDCEIGLYIRCLNHAWLNNGLPVDPEEIERNIPGRRSSATFHKLWERVSACFVPTSDGRLVNPRQEKERQEAIGKSKKAKASANNRWDNKHANAMRTHVRTHFGSDTDALPTQMPSQSVCNALQKSDTDNTPIVPFRKKEAAVPLVDAFQKFWELYPNKIGSDEACRQWISLVGSDITETSLPEIMAGLNRWLESDQWNRDDGRYISSPVKWLREKKWLDNPRAAEAHREPAPSSEGTNAYAEWRSPYRDAA